MLVDNPSSGFGVALFTYSNHRRYDADEFYDAENAKLKVFGARPRIQFVLHKIERGLETQDDYITSDTSTYVYRQQQQWSDISWLKESTGEDRQPPFPFPRQSAFFPGSKTAKGSLELFSTILLIIKSKTGRSNVQVLFHPKAQFVVTKVETQARDETVKLFACILHLEEVQTTP